MDQNRMKPLTYLKLHRTLLDNPHKSPAVAQKPARRETMLKMLTMLSLTILVVYLHSFSRCCENLRNPEKFAENSNLWSSRSSKVIDLGVNRKRICNFLLVINTLCPKKTCDYIFYNNFNNRCPITIIFGKVSSKSMRHRKMVSFPTSPIQCNYLTLGNHRTQKMTN